MIIIHYLHDLNRMGELPIRSVTEVTPTHLPEDLRTIARADYVAVADVRGEGMVHFLKDRGGVPRFMTWYDFICWLSAGPH